MTRLELEVMAAVERYREVSRRTMLRRLQELPGHAFIELALLGLERAGMVNVRTVRRAGSPGGEAHFSAIHRTGADEIRTAIVIRKTKYLNNIVEQDHRGVKRVTRPMLGFKSFTAAQDTLVGIELMHMIRKKQMVVEAGGEDLTAAEQFYSLAA